MATVCAKILKHHLKADGTYNVKIRVTHKSEKRYIDTEHYVTEKQLTKKMVLKDPVVEQMLNGKLIKYRVLIGELGPKLDFFTATQLRDYLADSLKEINFLEFCENYIRELKIDGREGSASNHTTVRNSLIDFFNREKVAVSEITAIMLKNYERYLRGPRKMKRINQLNKAVTIERSGLSDSGLYCHMRDLRTLFNVARGLYNDEDLGIVRIPHYPFKKYKIGSPPQTEKRNLTVDQIKQLRNCETLPGSRGELAKELFMLSFYMCGMNATDLYSCTKENVKNGRLNYNRVKTKTKRKDKAFISVKIIDEAKPLINKYLGKLPDRYSNRDGLTTALVKGLKDICKKNDIPVVTHYWARHTFASIARNECRCSIDDVGMALNHIDQTNRITDIYIAKDWRIIDDVQEKVMSMIVSK